MKRIVFVICLILFTACGCIFAKENNIQNHKVPAVYLMDNPKYKNVIPENIKYVKIIRYTEAGASEKDIKDRAEIISLYNHFKKVKLTNISGMGCTDNTTIYVFMLNDGSKAAIEIECEWIVLNGKSYNFVVEYSDNNSHK